jgi:hypothetical protein
MCKDTPFEEMFTMFIARPLSECVGVTTGSPQHRICEVPDVLGCGDRFSDRIHQSVGAFTLQQLKLIPTHLWVSRRIFGFADSVATARSGFPYVVPYVDCTQCDGINGKVPGKILWADVNEKIQEKDFILEFAH